MTITLGWWLVPTLVTVVAIGWAFLWGERNRSPGGYASIGDGIAGAFVLMAALAVSLLFWIAYLAILLLAK